MPTSTGLTDGFDAPTEAPTDWNTTGIEGVEGRDYTISITGYGPFIRDIERRMEEEDSIHEPPIERPVRRSNSRESPTNVVRGPEVGRTNSRSLRSYTSKDVLPKPGRSNAAGLAQRPIMEQGPDNKIAAWRQRVAQDSSISVSTHRKMNSTDTLPRQPSPSKGARHSSDGGKSKGTSKGSSGDYERTEFIISYQQPSRKAVAQQAQSVTASEIGLLSPRARRMSAAQNLAESSVASPRRSVAKAYQHTEYSMTQLHTPPRSSDSSSKSNSVQRPPVSPTQGGTYLPLQDTGGVSRITATSPVDLILSSCEPSLVHIGPVLSELGVVKMEHLRAVARLSPSTRDRELRDPALKRGVTVMEWAILLDKILTL
ncbi:uncharacterized protein PHACADRAFT_262458 [Phanerochaete carnosa HHB-10118-sp]|uniref:Uncharacterized protein n=1 Tax=Phanerochaete carnosa (strain HHB-10118-sp) TaxID=650164 RepID=K5VZG6_PHACS|nr:uncharacterized protein PHACADRAFT_262458 [Phanerochaete carnosa HHB-10118-sp]EKM52009.1 hypothetical protein PHACADRAFT_262458 [Phanerochaete carnosa HHB-10118-sp]